eukprot:10796531-Alexandrium_andersonii.AAC.1
MSNSALAQTPARWRGPDRDQPASHEIGALGSVRWAVVALRVLVARCAACVRTPANAQACAYA